MSTTPCWLAGASSPLLDLSRTSQALDNSTRDLALTVGACVLVSIPVLVWAVYFRKRRRRHDLAPNPAAAATHKHHRRRHRRREHRRRNPTLAETGGLPPVRREAASEPQAQV